MNITFIRKSFFPRNAGGEVEALGLMKTLVSFGMKVSVITSLLEATPREEEFHGINVYRVDIPEIPRLRVPLFSLRAMLFLLINLDRIKPHIVILDEVDCTVFGFLLRLTDIPLIFYGRGFYHEILPGNEPLVGFFGKLIESVCFRLVHLDAIVSTDRRSLQYYLKLNPRVKKVLFLPTSVERDFFAHANEAIDGKMIREKYDLSQRDFVIGCTKKFSPVTGVRFLVEAFIEASLHVDSLKLILVGGGALKDELKTIAEKANLGDNVVLVDRVPHRLIPHFLASFDLVVIPGIGGSQKNALLEAMAMGKPVIGTTAASIPEVITHLRNGIVIPPRDSEKLAEAILNLYEDVELRSRLSETAMKDVLEKYTWNINSRNFCDFVYSICGKVTAD